MTKQEAAVVSAYTGVMLGDFSDMHGYIEKLLDRPVWTHEFAGKQLKAKIKEAAKADFIAITVKE